MRSSFCRRAADAALDSERDVADLLTADSVLIIPCLHRRLSDKTRKKGKLISEHGVLSEGYVCVITRKISEDFQLPPCSTNLYLFMGCAL